MLTQFLDIILHLDVHLAQWSASLGVWTYALLFLIIFAETGLVVTPFLPGDSLLFAAGALAALPGSGVEIFPLWGLLILAAFAGDNTNYQIGRYFGPKIFNVPKSPFLNPQHLKRTHDFYDEHGVKTVIFARFMPIIRTFAPFVAGIARMNLKQFMVFSFLGSLLWMSCFLFAGFYFGNISEVKRNFHFVIIAVIFISFLPMIMGLLKQRIKSN